MCSSDARHLIFEVAPSQAIIYRDMFKAEMKEREKLDAPSTGTPVTICLDTALKIQSKQWVLIIFLKLFT